MPTADSLVNVHGRMDSDTQRKCPAPLMWQGKGSACADLALGRFVPEDRRPSVGNRESPGRIAASLGGRPFP